MLFTSSLFLQIFLPFTLFVTVLLRRNFLQNIFLLFASLLFYAWGEPEKVAILIASVVINYFVAVLWLQPKKPQRVRQAALTVGIVINLALLVVCKYTPPCLQFCDAYIAPLPFKLPDFALPLGISFYTFQSISYLIDVYRGTNAPQKNLVALGLFITFFPQLVAGPIIKYHDIEPRLKKRAMTLGLFTYGLRRFIYGLAKKVLIANQVAYLADDIFAMPFSQLDTATAWLGALAYSLQIYFDFSGYSDMAIGLGRMFGFHFQENFNLPYASKSIQEFWRRWHISLSTWFRDYLYIPLGGSRAGNFRTCVNILIVFAVTGIWHGAGMNFLLWGIYYGILLILERLFLKSYLDNAKLSIPAHIYTLTAVILGWVLFRAESLSGAVCFLKTMFSFQKNPELPLNSFITVNALFLIVAGVLFCAPIQYLIKPVRNAIERTETTVSDIIILPLLLAACIILLAGNTYNPFIYFRF